MVVGILAIVLVFGCLLWLVVMGVVTLVTNIIPLLPHWSILVIIAYILLSCITG